MRCLELVVCVAVMASAALVHADARPLDGAGKARGGLRTSITTSESYASGAPVRVTVEVENTTDAPIDIHHDLQFFAVVVSWPTPSREGCKHRYTGTRRRTINFQQTNRGQLPPTPRPLAPGAKLSYEADLSSWARSSGNGRGGSVQAGFKPSRATARPRRSRRASSSRARLPKDAARRIQAGHSGVGNSDV